MAEEKLRETESSEKPKRGKNSLILIVIIGVLVALLIGGGIVAAIVMTKGNSAKADVAAEPAADTAPGKKGKAGKEAKKEGPKAPAIYVGLEPPFVVNFDASQSSRFLQVTVEIMTRDSNMAKMLQENDPAVRNDLLMLFGGQNATEIGTREGKEALRKSALATVRQLIGTEGGRPELVEAIYFTTFVMQ
jgi:flagellar FliL protein